MSHETIFRWKSITSNILVPMIDIEMRSKSGEWKIFYPVVDTGAVISVFSVNDCERLGYTLTDGDYFDLMGGLGGAYPSWIHELEFKIGQDVFRARVAFTEKRHNKQYIGLVDMFDKFDISFMKNQETRFVKI
jgi:hypothetical protein